MCPGAVLGAAEDGRRRGLHQEARIALETHSLVEGEVGAKLDAIGQATWVATADDCVGNREMHEFC